MLQLLAGAFRSEVVIGVGPFGCGGGAIVALSASFAVGQQFAVGRGRVFDFAFAFLDLVCLSVLEVVPGDVGQLRAILDDLLERSSVLFDLQFGGGVVELNVLLAVDLVELGILAHRP
jgi:hypothetical protein